MEFVIFVTVIISSIILLTAISWHFAWKPIFKSLENHLKTLETNHERNE